MIGRRAAAALACVLLTACAQSSSSTATTAEPTATPGNACALPGFWQFRGACISGDIGTDGASVVLPKYRRMTLTMTFGKGNAPSSLPFIFANATGNGDIGGKLNGKVPFPVFGSVACVTPANAPARCDGKALMYVLVVNAGTHPVTFVNTPMIAVGGTGTLDGLKQCSLSTLIWSNPQRFQAAWVVRNYQAVMADLGMAFKPIGVHQRYGNGGAFTIFAITCT